MGTATYEVRVPVGNNGEDAVPDDAAYTVDGCSTNALASASLAAASAAGEDPAPFGLDAPYPNPASGRATVRFALDEATDVRLAVYDALGREVAVLVDGVRQPGRHEAVFDDLSLVTGTYLVRLTVGSQTATRRLTLLR